TVWVVDRVHNDTTDGWAPALPTHTTSFAPTNVDLLGVADLTNSRAAADVYASDLGGWHTQNCVGAFLTKKLDGSASGTCQLCTCAWLQLHIVDGGTSWDVTQWQVVTNLDVGCSAGLDNGALGQALRCEDVTLLAIEVVKQCNVSGTVWVVLDVSDLRQYAILVI